MSKTTRPVDSKKSFEHALAAKEQERFVLRLYVAGSTPRSIQAVANIRSICEETLHGRYELEVIDIYQHPDVARPEQIVVAPTLIRKLPLPVRRIIGNLSSREQVLAGLDLIRRRTGG